MRARPLKLRTAWTQFYACRGSRDGDADMGRTMTRFVGDTRVASLLGTAFVPHQLAYVQEGALVGRTRRTDNVEDDFGNAVASLGELSGFHGLAVGGAEDDDGGAQRGVVWMLSLDDGGAVQRATKITATEAGAEVNRVGPLAGRLDGDRFGISAAETAAIGGGGAAGAAILLIPGPSGNRELPRPPDLPFRIL